MTSRTMAAVATRDDNWTFAIAATLILVLPTLIAVSGMVVR